MVCHPPRSGRDVIGALLRLAALAALAWGLGFLWFVATLPPAAPVALATDAVVVLTGGPGRLLRGLEVLDAGSARRMLVSGVAPEVTPATLADILPAAQQSRARALFIRRVDLGYAAIDTRSNAEETAAWMAHHRFRSLRLVTSAGHMRRAELELVARLPPGIAILADSVPVTPQPASLAREYSKYILRLAAIRLGLGGSA